MLGCVVLLLGASCQATAYDFTIELKLNGRRIEGTPLAWSSADIAILGRDGRLWSFSPREAADFRRTADGFRGYSPADMRGQLQREFGKSFAVSGTGHYLVVHPTGERDLWASRFEELYRSFVHYFSRRGWRPVEPQFPLVAVVFPRQEDFRRYAAANGKRLLNGTLGYYSPGTNRIMLYDATAQYGAANWHINAETIIHEAAHQVAFNTGVHHRFATTPHWLAEGLATMFEAPGVWNSRLHPNRRDRINDLQLESFRRYLSKRSSGEALNQVIVSDRLFSSDPTSADAESWALTFFLVETMPRKYMDYLRRTAARPAFSEYGPEDRLRDFTESFGNNLPLLEAHYSRFMQGLN
jgi:hypothetical protein